MKTGITKFVSICAGALAFGMALHASANVITFVTPPGATTAGGPVDASATFTTGIGALAITLTDLQANPTDVAQLLSDLDFTLSGGQTTGTLVGSAGTERIVNGNGTFTIGPTVATGWGLNQNVFGGLQLEALGFVGPAHLIIGDPNASNIYSNANGSIAGNGPHNPFLYGTATFVISNIPGLTPDSRVTSATFSFGTTPGINVPGVPPRQSVPEPASLALLATGLLALRIGRRARKA